MKRVTPDDPDVRHGTAELPGVALHVAEVGPRDGPVAILLHGFPETWWSWRKQLGPLAAAGFRVVMPDLRGYGASSRGGPFDLDTMAGDVAGLARSLGAGPVFLVGHDWGGAIAWHVAARHPEVVRRLVVFDCPMAHVLEAKLARQMSWEQVKKSWYIFFFQLPFIAEWLIGRRDARAIPAIIRRNVADRAVFDDAELAPFRDAARSFAARRAMLGVYRAAFRDALKRGLRPSVPPTVMAETLLVWGLADRALGFDDLVPDHARYVPRLRVEKLSGVGHFPHSERPDLVNPLLLEFLGRRPETEPS